MLSGVILRQIAAKDVRHRSSNATGYSSLSYLLNYPFDVVKIDQSFVRHLDKDPQRADVVRMLVDLAASLNKHLVAEGVERMEEMIVLKEFGCELVQGYLLSKPLSVEAVEALLELHRGNAVDSRSAPEGIRTVTEGIRTF